MKLYVPISQSALKHAVVLCMSQPDFSIGVFVEDESMRQNVITQLNGYTEQYGGWRYIRSENSATFRFINNSQIHVPPLPYPYKGCRVHVALADFDSISARTKRIIQSCETDYIDTRCEYENL